MYRGLRTLQAASLVTILGYLGRYSFGRLRCNVDAGSHRSLSKTYSGTVFFICFTFKQTKKTHKKVEPAGSTDPRPPLPFELQREFSQLESRGSEGKGEGVQ